HQTKPPKPNELGAAFVSERRRANARSLNSRIAIASKVVNALRGNLIAVMRVVCYAETFYCRTLGLFRWPTRGLENSRTQELKDSRRQEGKKARRQEGKKARSNRRLSCLIKSSPRCCRRRVVRRPIASATRFLESLSSPVLELLTWLVVTSSLRPREIGMV